VVLKTPGLGKAIRTERKAKKKHKHWSKKKEHALTQKGMEDI